MSDELANDFADVLAVVERGAPSPPAELLERIEAAVADEPAESWLDRCGDDAYALLETLLGPEALAEEALEEAWFRHRCDPELAPGRLVAEAAIETLRLLEKAGRPSGSLTDELSPAARVWLLSGGVDLESEPPRDALRAALGELTQVLRHRLRPACRDRAETLAETAARIATAAERQVLHDHMAYCKGCATAYARLPDEPEDGHAGDCEACALMHARLEEALEVGFGRIPDREGLERRVAARLERERALQARVEEVGLRVSLQCSFCHGGLTRGESVFCAACLAPHHGDCFRDHGRCSALGCEETETVRAGEAGAPRQTPPEEEPAETPWATRRTAARLLWLGLGGLLSAAAFGAYIAYKDQANFEALVDLQRQYAEQAKVPTPGSKPPSDQVAVHLWQRIRNAKARKDYPTWHRLAVELWHRHPNSPYTARLELPLPLMGTRGYRVYVNGVAQERAPAGQPLIAIYKPSKWVRVVAKSASETAKPWTYEFKGNVYQPLGSVWVAQVMAGEAEPLQPIELEVEGVLEAYDARRRMLTLENGAVYVLAVSADRAHTASLALKRGDRVRLEIAEAGVVGVTKGWR